MVRRMRNFPTELTMVSRGVRLISGGRVSKLFTHTDIFPNLLLKPLLLLITSVRITIVTPRRSPSFHPAAMFPGASCCPHLSLLLGVCEWGPPGQALRPGLVVGSGGGGGGMYNFYNRYDGNMMGYMMGYIMGYTTNNQQLVWIVIWRILIITSRRDITGMMVNV